MHKPMRGIVADAAQKWIRRSQRTNSRVKLSQCHRDRRSQIERAPFYVLAVPRATDGAIMRGRAVPGQHHQRLIATLGPDALKKRGQSPRPRLTPASRIRRAREIMTRDLLPGEMRTWA